MRNSFEEEIELKVHIKYFSALREITHAKEEVVDVQEACTVLDLLRSISDKYGESVTKYLFDLRTHEPRSYLQFFIGDTPISELNGFATVVTSGCTFTIIPPIGGG